MFSEDKYIEVYTDFDNDFYLPTMIKNGVGYIVSACGDDGEKNPTFIPWSDVKYINRMSGIFKNGKVRFGEDIEVEVLKELKINVNREKYYNRRKIEGMILNPTDAYIQEILDIKDTNIIQSFVAILTSLENTNEYNISNKISTYIRARYDELSEGIKETELVLIPTKQVVIETDDEEEEDLEEEEEVKETKPKTPTNKGKGRPKSVAKK